jgi:hypothetical protein
MDLTYLHFLQVIGGMKQEHVFIRGMARLNCGYRAILGSD